MGSLPLLGHCGLFSCGKIAADKKRKRVASYPYHFRSDLQFCIDLAGNRVKKLHTSNTRSNPRISSKNMYANVINSEAHDSALN